MKHLTSVIFFGFVLTGCNSVYGPSNAPVVDLAHRPVAPGGQTAAPLFHSPTPPRAVPQQPVPPRAVPPQRRPLSPPPVVNNQPQPVQNPYQQSTPVPPPSRPVATAATPAQPPAGWNVAPQSGNTVVIVDQPKLGKPTVPEAPVISRSKPLVDEPKLGNRDETATANATNAANANTPTTATPQKEVVAVKQATQEAPKPTPAPTPAVPPTPTVAQKPEPAPEPPKPARPAPLRPKPASNTLEDAIVENNNSNSRSEVATRTPTNSNANSGGTAVSSLLRRASASLSKGNLDEAVAYLENAQRIDPRNSKILYDIANIRFHQGRYRDAENIAGKATQIGSGSMVKKSWRLISKAREALGDKQGALQAAEKAAQ